MRHPGGLETEPLGSVYKTGRRHASNGNRRQPRIRVLPSEAHGRGHCGQHCGRHYDSPVLQERPSAYPLALARQHSQPEHRRQRSGDREIRAEVGSDEDHLPRMLGNMHCGEPLPASIPDGRLFIRFASAAMPNDMDTEPTVGRNDARLRIAIVRGRTPIRGRTGRASRLRRRQLCSTWDFATPMPSGPALSSRCAA